MLKRSHPTNLLGHSPPPTRSRSLSLPPTTQSCYSEVSLLLSDDPSDSEAEARSFLTTTDLATTRGRSGDGDSATGSGDSTTGSGDLATGSGDGGLATGAGDLVEVGGRLRGRGLGDRLWGRRRRRGGLGGVVDGLRSTRRLYFFLAAAFLAVFFLAVFFLAVFFLSVAFLGFFLAGAALLVCAPGAAAALLVFAAAAALLFFGATAGRHVKKEQGTQNAEANREQQRKQRL